MVAVAMASPSGSMATMGRYRGGPAKVAVLASAFFGTISGSAVANVLMDGGKDEKEDDDE